MRASSVYNTRYIGSGFVKYIKESVDHYLHIYLVQNEAADLSSNLWQPKENILHENYGCSTLQDYKIIPTRIILMLRLQSQPIEIEFCVHHTS